MSIQPAHMPAYAPASYSSLHGLVVTEIHSDTEAHLTRALEMDAEGIVLTRSPARTATGRFVWLEFAVPPNGRVRVLAEVVGRSAEVTRFSFKHFWPADRARYMRFIARAMAA